MNKLCILVMPSSSRDWIEVTISLYRCVQKKSLLAHFLDARKADHLYWQFRKVLNPDWGQGGGFWNIDGHDIDNLIAKWLEKDSIHTNSARRIQIWAPKNHLDGCLSKSWKPRNYRVRNKKVCWEPGELGGQISKFSKFKPVRPKCRQGPN